VLDIGVKEDIVNKSGAWFSYGEERLGQGRERVKEFLTENTDLAEKIEIEIKGKIGLTKEPPKEKEPEAEAGK
jgi:recombination protein RecA